MVYISRLFESKKISDSPLVVKELGTGSNLFILGNKLTFKKEYVIRKEDSNSYVVVDPFYSSKISISEIIKTEDFCRYTICDLDQGLHVFQGVLKSNKKVKVVIEREADTVRFTCTIFQIRFQLSGTFSDLIRHIEDNFSEINTCDICKKSVKKLKNSIIMFNGLH